MSAQPETPEVAETAHGRELAGRHCSAVALASTAIAMAAGGRTLSPPYVFSGKPFRGTRLGARSKDGEPFQDGHGKWYVRSKGTIRRYSSVPNAPHDQSPVKSAQQKH